jgi:hypothetical protein
MSIQPMSTSIPLIHRDPELYQLSVKKSGNMRMRIRAAHQGVRPVCECTCA